MSLPGAIGAGVDAAGGASEEAARDHPNWDLVPLMEDADGNAVRDTLDEKAVGTPDATVYLHLLYDRRPTAADATLLEDAFGALRTYVFNNFDWVKVETTAGRVAGMLDAPGVIAIEEFVPPVIQNVEATQTTRVRDYAGATNDGFDHTQSVHDELGFRGEGMVVAILDTGVDNKHPMLDDLDDDPTTVDPKLVINEDPTTGAPLIGGADASDGFVVRGCVDPVDDHLHGTHVAGTAVGTRGQDVSAASPLLLDVPGVAPQARMVDVDIAVPIGTGVLGGIVNPVGSAIGFGEDIAFDWIIDFNQGETCFGDPGDLAIDVASMSFGSGGANPAVTQNVGISQVAMAGITFSVSAGNSGPNQATLTSGAEGGILVAASDDRNTPDRADDVLAEFSPSASSSRGPRQFADGDADTLDELRPDIAAPGLGISSAGYHSQGVFGFTASGTSMSAPHVAGVAALMLQAADAEGIDLRPVDATGDWRDMGLEGAVPIRDLIQKSAEYRDEVPATDPAVQQTATGKFGLPWNNGWGYGLIDAFAAVTLAMDGGDDGTPTVTIDAPADGATVPPEETAVSGTVDRQGGSQPLAADAGGPYSGTVGDAIAISGSASGGASGDGFACAWSGDSAMFDDAAACETTVTYAAQGDHTIVLTVDDGDETALDSTAVSVVDDSGPEALYFTNEQIGQGAAVDCGPTPTYESTMDEPTSSTSEKAYLGRAAFGITCAVAFETAFTEQVTLEPVVRFQAWMSCDIPSAAPGEAVLAPFTFDVILAVDGTDVPGSRTQGGGDFVCDGSTVIPMELDVPTGGVTVGAGSTLAVEVLPWWVAPLGANDPVPNLHLLVESTTHPSALELVPGGALSGGADAATSLGSEGQVDDPAGDSVMPGTDLVEAAVVAEDADTFTVRLDVDDLAEYVPASVNVDEDPIVVPGVVTINPSTDVGAPTFFTVGFDFDEPTSGSTFAYQVSAVKYVQSVGGDAEQYVLQVTATGTGANAVHTVQPLSGVWDAAGGFIEWTVPKAAMNVDSAASSIAGGITRNGAPPTTGDTIASFVAESRTWVFAGAGLGPGATVWDTAGPGGDYTFTGGDAPLTADAGGPYAGAPEAAIAVSGSFTGGDGSATCAWSTADDGSFADASACDTSVTFDTAGAKTVTLAVTDPTGSDADAASVTVEAGPAGERVEILVDGVVHDDVPVATGDEPSDAFNGTVDLSGLTGAHTITADWYDADGTLLASDSVSVTVDSSTSTDVTIDAPGDGATVEPPVLFSGTFDAGSGDGASGEGAGSTSSTMGGASGALAAAQVMQTLWFQTLSERLGDAPGFLGVTPSLDGANTLTAHYATEPPEDLPTQFVPTGWTLSAEQVTFEPAIRSVQLVPGAGPMSDARTGPPQPAASTGIGPGSAIIMTIPGEGTFGCTANFVWRDAETGKHYLGAAGHCFLPGGATATHGPHADYDASGVRTWVCVEQCEFGGLSGQIFTDHTVELGRVAFAQQGPGLVDWLPVDPLGANPVLSFGDDFGLVEIPVEQYDRVRTHLPVWNGPTEPTGSIAVGQPIVQYGHSLGFGETFGTQARTGVLSVPWSLETGPWYAAHPGAQGDSGSPVVLAAATDPTTTVVEGTNAVGILTHLGVPAGTTAGTYVDHAVDMATQAGLEVSMLLEGDDLVLPGTTAQFSTTISSFDVAFTDESFSPDGIVEWAWEFGDGASSPDQHPVHTYAGAGTYTASLTVTDGAGVTATASQTLEVTGDPDPTTPTVPNGQTVDVTLSEDESKHFKIPVPADATRLDVVMGGPACDAVSCPIDADLYVRFSQRATNNEYDCRPFLTSNDESCAFTSPDEGLWYIRVHAFSGSGTVQLTATHDGSENGAPTASFTYETDNLTVVVDGSASSDPDGDALSYSWDFGDGATATGETATHTYEAGGTYTVTLTVDDGNGGTDADSQDVTVTSQPASWGVWLRLTGPDGLVFDWTKVKDVEAGTNGTWSQMWDQVGEPVEGEYVGDVELREGEAIRASDNVAFVVEVPNEPPTASLSTDPNPTEEHAEVTFTLSASDADGSIASWSLDFGDGSTPATGTGAPPASLTHAYDQKGDYTATLAVTDDEGAGASDSVTVTVEDGPNAAPTAHIEGPDRATAGTEVTFDGSGSTDADGTIVEWRWDMGDGTILFGETVTHSYSAPGKMDVVLTVTDDDGATATATHRHVVQGGGPPT